MIFVLYVYVIVSSIHRVFAIGVRQVGNADTYLLEFLLLEFKSIEQKLLSAFQSEREISTLSCSLGVLRIIDFTNSGWSIFEGEIEGEGEDDSKQCFDFCDIFIFLTKLVVRLWWIGMGIFFSYYQNLIVCIGCTYAYFFANTILRYQFILLPKFAEINSIGESFDNEEDGCMGFCVCVNSEVFYVFADQQLLRDYGAFLVIISYVLTDQCPLYFRNFLLSVNNFILSLHYLEFFARILQTCLAIYSSFSIYLHQYFNPYPPHFTTAYLGGIQSILDGERWADFSICTFTYYLSLSLCPLITLEVFMRWGPSASSNSKAGGYDCTECSGVLMELTLYKYIQMQLQIRLGLGCIIYYQDEQ